MNKKIILIITISCLLLLAAVFLYYYEMRVRSFKKDYVQVKEVYFSGDYSASIPVLQALLQQAPDKEKEAYAKMFLGASYIKRNQEPDDLKKGTQLFKEVINDLKVPPRARALAYNDIADYTLGNGVSFFKLYFPEAPFNSFVPSLEKDSNNAVSSSIRDVYFKILELSMQVYPTSYAEYAIAGNYYAPLLVNNVSIGTTTEETAQILQTYVQKGDERNDAYLYVHSLLLRGYLYRALAITASGRVLETPIAEREAAWKFIFDKASTFTDVANNQSVYQVLMKARFYYANFLMRDIGASRDADIREILKPFGEASSTSATLSRDAYVRAQTMKLAKLSPEFSAYLTRVGFEQ